MCAGPSANRMVVYRGVVQNGATCGETMLVTAVSLRVTMQMAGSIRYPLITQPRSVIVHAKCGWPHRSCLLPWR